MKQCLFVDTCYSEAAPSCEQHCSDYSLVGGISGLQQPAGGSESARKGVSRQAEWELSMVVMVSSNFTTYNHGLNVCFTNS